MLVLTVKGEEMWDERTNEFAYGPPLVLHLEHSLYAIALWESKWQIPFLGKKDLTDEQLYDYITCMAEENITIDDARKIPIIQVQEIARYMENKMTATWFSDRDNKQVNNREVVTAELVYYWMTALQIPFSCEKWNFNRLMTLIRVCSIKNQPPKKMSKGATMAQNNALNKDRRARLKSKG